MAVTENKSPESLSPSPSPSPSSESSFRELDDAFLQNQARIWLGEVLQIRFEEQMSMCDLLADGELLFELSEVISRMLPTPAVEATHLKMNEWKSLGSSKSTKRYMPYYNVGSFLRMCKNLGLNGIDLFSPSDVVEKRNTRKVCICLRSLSKKVRSRDLNVPDFDSVTRTLSMPTDMVQCIRKSLELSQSSPSSSVEHDSEKVSRVKGWQRMSPSTSAVSNGYSSDNCDDAESKFIVAESYGSSDYACDAATPSDTGSQVVRDYSPEPLKVQLQITDLENEENEQCEYLSIAESVGSPFSQYYSDEELSSLPSSAGLGSRISGKVLEEEAESVCQNDVDHVPIDWDDSSLAVENYKDRNADIDEIDCISHEKKDIDTTCYNGCSPTRENKTCNVHIENSSHPSEVDVDHGPVDWKDSSLHHEDCRNGNASYDDTDYASNEKKDTETTCCNGCFPTGENNSYNVCMRNSFDTSEVDGEKSLYDNNQQLHSKSSISDGGRGFSVPHDCVVGEGLCSNEDPLPKFTSPEDGQVDNDAGKHEMAILGSSRSSDGKLEVEDNNLFNELLFESTADYSSHNAENPESQLSPEVINAEGNVCCNSLNSANTTSDNLADQVESRVEQCPSLADTDSKVHGFSCLHPDPRSVAQSLECPQLLLGRDTVISAALQNGKEVFGANMITSDHTEGCSDNHLMDGNASNSTDMDFSSSPHIVVAKDNINCSEDDQHTLEGPEEHKFLSEDISGKPINIEGVTCSDNHLMRGNASISLNMSDTSSSYIMVAEDSMECSDDDHDKLEGSEDYNVPAESINGKPINIGDAPTVGHSPTTLSDPQAGAENPKSVEDSGHKQRECAENMVEGESELKDIEKEMSKSQPKRKLLKSVVKGTALVGIAVFLLHLRKNGGANLPKAKKHPIEAVIRFTPKASVPKSQKGGSSSSVYPAEKLNLGI